MLQPCVPARGLTLLELLSVLALAAIALSVGAPSLRWLVLDSERSATINAFVASAQLARSAAVRRQLPVVVCPGAEDAPCAADADWSQGWSVFVNRDRDDPPRLDPGEPILHRAHPPRGLQIRANRGAFVFRRIGLRATNGTVTLCDSRGAAHARAVIVSYTGRTRVSRRRADGSPLVC